MQTRLGSFIEAWANIAVGFTVNWCANMAILPLFGYHVTDGTLHADKAAWRALARAQEIHERRGAPLAPAARLP